MSLDLTTAPVPPATVRVGYVVKMYPRFSETFIVSEILAREARGADIEIFSLRPPVDARFHDALARVQAPVTYVPRHRKTEELWAAIRHAQPLLPRLAGSLPDLLGASADDAGQAVELAVMVVQRGLTHLHAHFATVPTTVARLAAKLTGVTYSFTAHAKDIFHSSVEPLDLQRKLRDADHVVTISAYNHRHLTGVHGADPERLHLVYNGLDLDAFTYQPLRTVDGDVPVIAAVGRLVEKKGFGVLIDACRVLRERGVPMRCRIVGSGALEADLRAQVTALGLTDVVELTGPLPQDQVREVLRGATVMAAPCVVGSDGNADGLPTVLLEAMALGTPTVATDVTGLTEAVRHEQTGLVVDQHDADALADALQRLLTDTSLRTRLAAAARQLIEDVFDSRRQAATLDALLSPATATATPMMTEA